MRTIKSKRLIKKVSTVCDYNTLPSKSNFSDTDNPTGTDPTNITIITLTTNTHLKA
jgi:hypothetical protein